MLKNNIRTTTLYIYYAILMAVLLSWTNPEAAPPDSLRYAFLGAITLPLLFDGSAFTIAIISIFYTISYYGYAFSYMPQSIIIYVIILALCILLNKNKSYASIRIEGWHSFVVFGLYFIFINTITSSNPLIANGSSILLCFFIPFFISKDRNESVKILEHSFIIISIIMSVQYLMIGDKAILVANQDGSGLVRTGWTDPNHYASIIGMGVVISVMLLMELKERTLISSLYYGSAIILSIIVVLLNASRGAAISIALSVLFLVFMSKVKTRYKILVTVFVTVLLIGLYNYGFFDLLKVRMTTGDVTAGERTVIWSNKLNAFINSNNPLSLLFGVGFENGLVLGTNYPVSAHNDYVCAFVDYGLVGLILFLIVLILPVVKTPTKRRSIVFALAAYLWAVGLTLTPLTEGFLPYFVFLIYVFSKMQMYRQQEVLNKL